MSDQALWENERMYVETKWFINNLLENVRNETKSLINVEWECLNSISHCIIYKVKILSESVCK